MNRKQFLKLKAGDIITFENDQQNPNFILSLMWLSKFGSFKSAIKPNESIVVVENNHLHKYVYVVHEDCSTPDFGVIGLSDLQNVCLKQLITL